MVEPLAPRDPRRIGRYEILGRLGQGGMGVVYLGRSPAGRRVAIKTMREDLSADPALRARFAREIAAARRVSGAFTAGVEDMDAEGEQLWLATVYVDGPSLQELVVRHGPLPPEHVWTIGAQLVEALQGIHREGIVHRDLKPGNILMSSEGPKVIDFGIASVAESAPVTTNSEIGGTLLYMAPEAFSGVPLDAAADIFALGGVLVFAATGHPPFNQAEHPTALIGAILTAEPQLYDVPAPLQPILAACLSRIGSSARVWTGCSQTSFSAGPGTTRCPPRGRAFRSPAPGLRTWDRGRRRNPLRSRR